MSKSRTFTKAEILDAATAAAQTGLDVNLHKDGGIQFTHGTQATKISVSGSSSEDALKRWRDGSKDSGRA